MCGLSEVYPVPAMKDDLYNFMKEKFNLNFSDEHTMVEQVMTGLGRTKNPKPAKDEISEYVQIF